MPASLGPTLDRVKTWLRTRRTFATQHVKRGTKLDVVRQALGHADLKTTAIYVGLARDVMDKELQANAL